MFHIWCGVPGIFSNKYFCQAKGRWHQQRCTVTCATAGNEALQVSNITCQLSPQKSLWIYRFEPSNNKLVSVHYVLLLYPQSFTIQFKYLFFFVADKSYPYRVYIRRTLFSWQSEELPPTYWITCMKRNSIYKISRILPIHIKWLLNPSKDETQNSRQFKFFVSIYYLDYNFFGHHI